MNNQPVQQPPNAPGVQGHTGNRLAKNAQTFGILAIVCFLVPFVGIGFGVASLILARKARSENAQAEVPVKQASAPAILGVVGTGLSIAGTAWILLVVGGFLSQFGSSSDSGEYGQYVAIVEDQQKEYQADEIAEIGPIDILATSTVRGYVPTPAEQEIFDAPEPSVKRNGTTQTDQNRSSEALEGDSQYVQVRMTVQYNDARAAELSGLAFSTGSWVDELASFELNGTRSFITYINETQLKRSTSIDYTTEQAIRAGDKTNITFIYRIPASDPRGELAYTIVIFTNVSWLVGTEGMPSKLFEYKITLW